LEQYSDIKFHEYPPSGSRVVPCGQTDRHTDVTKLIVPFRNFANAPKMTACCANDTARVGTLCGQKCKFLALKVAVSIVTTRLFKAKQFPHTPCAHGLLSVPVSILTVYNRRTDRKYFLTRVHRLEI
jgi:hypothetical protein